MSCKLGECYPGRKDSVICCALCPIKDTCPAFCSNLPSPQDCGNYEDCENFIKPTYGDGVEIKSSCWHYDHDSCKYQDPRHCNHISIHGEKIQCPRIPIESDSVGRKQDD